MRKIERHLIGKQFGELTVIKFNSNINGKRRWIVKCNKDKCGKEYSISENRLLYSKITTCYECSSKKRRLKNTVNIMLWQTIKYSAKKRNIGISPVINREYLYNLYIKQNRKCALSGQNIYLSASITDKKENTASVDRIDSSKGYIPNNLQWVHKKVNKMKWDLSQDYFIKLCEKVATNNK
ncbi:MAG TPA: hypothetical protein VMZ91_08270 [Candidatus Paceibacterota bacterium]|nr:hypothetical protein [Candidatus Paceibacterota bacterium]